MTAKNLIKILSAYPPKSQVSLVFFNGFTPEVADIKEVCPNGGPSIYARGWNPKSCPLRRLEDALEFYDCDPHDLGGSANKVIAAARRVVAKGGAS